MLTKFIVTVVTILGITHGIQGGYPQSGYYYPSALQTAVVGQSAISNSYYSPASVIQVQQKQPLQLRPPALPNTRPAVVAVHAEQRPPQVVRPVYPASPVPAPPSVVAIHAQRPVQAVVPVAAQVVQVPNYSFAYAVKDVVTGDEKSHEETRTGDNVVGKYTVVEPDGTLRTVTYTAGIHGFNAIVERTPGYAPPNAPAKVVAVSKPVVVSSSPIGFPAAIAVSRPVSVPTYPAGFHFGG